MLPASSEIFLKFTEIVNMSTIRIPTSFNIDLEFEIPEFHRRLLAWIIDKYRDWSDCEGDLERRWDRDTLLTVATLYWATGTIGSSFRQYYNYDLNDPVPQIAVPAAVTLSGEPAYATYPRSLAERVFTDLRHWNAPHRGGHFMAHEEPAQVASELRTFFGPLRS